MALKPIGPRRYSDFYIFIAQLFFFSFLSNVYLKVSLLFARFLFAPFPTPSHFAPEPPPSLPPTQIGINVSWESKFGLWILHSSAPKQQGFQVESFESCHVQLDTFLSITSTRADCSAHFFKTQVYISVIRCVFHNYEVSSTVSHVRLCMLLIQKCVIDI